MQAWPKLKVAGLVIGLTIATPGVADTVAVGFFEKRGAGLELELLQYEIPTAVINRLTKKDDGLDIISPEQQQIAFGRNLGPTGNYSPQVIRRIQETFAADFFVTGRVASAADGLNIRTTVYSKDKKISIIVTAQSPADLNKAVDKITQWVYERINDKEDLVAGSMRPGSRVGFITNLDPVQQNYLTIFFAQAGFIVSAAGQNEGRPTTDGYVQAFETIKVGGSEVGPGAFVPNYDPDHPELQSTDDGYEQWFYTDRQKEEQQAALLKKRADIEKNAATSLSGLGRTYKLDYLIVLYIDRSEDGHFCRIIDLTEDTIVYFNDRQEIPKDEIEPSSWRRFTTELIQRLKPAGQKVSGEKK